LQIKNSQALASPNSCKSSQAKTWDLQRIRCSSVVGFPSLGWLAFCSNLS